MTISGTSVFWFSEIVVARSNVVKISLAIELQVVLN